VIGLDRAPEVKTVRRKLKILAAGPSEQLVAKLAERRAKRNEGVLGFLYVDGHVRVYSGKHRLPKAHVTRMRISLPATPELLTRPCDDRGLTVVIGEVLRRD
jgi:prepilin-type processing-associated H-X9-DG protein